MTPAWIVCAWPPVLLKAQSTLELKFVHLGTRVRDAGDPGHHTAGQTVWGNRSVQPSAGLAWDWVQLQEGVFAIADPLGLVSNLRLVGPRGETLSAMQAALYLNEVVRALPWQGEVRRALQCGQPLEASLHH